MRHDFARRLFRVVTRLPAFALIDTRVSGGIGAAICCRPTGDRRRLPASDSRRQHTRSTLQLMLLHPFTEVKGGNRDNCNWTPVSLHLLLFVVGTTAEARDGNRLQEYKGRGKWVPDQERTGGEDGLQAKCRQGLCIHCSCLWRRFK